MDRLNKLEDKIMADLAALNAKIADLQASITANADAITSLKTAVDTCITDVNAAVARLLALIAAGAPPADFQPQIDAITAAQATLGTATQAALDEVTPVTSEDAQVKLEGN